MARRKREVTTQRERNRKFIKKFNKKHFPIVLELIREARKYVGKVYSAKVTKDVKIKTRGHTNYEEFCHSRGIKKNYGDQIIPMEFEYEILPKDIAVSFILWKTDVFGTILTTQADMERMLKEIFEKVVYSFNTCIKVELTLIEMAIQWVMDATYADSLGSVSPIFTYEYDGDIVSFYLDGTCSFNNVTDDGYTVSDEELAAHLLGELRRRTIDVVDYRYCS